MIKYLPLALIHGFFATAFVGVLGIRHFSSKAAADTNQPITNFSHEIHVGKQKIACSQCHEHFDRSRRPGIPTLNVCMSCHKDGPMDRAGIQQLHEHVKSERPIQWNRIHTLPEHVYFTHKRHVKALSEKGGLQLWDEKGIGNVDAQAKLCSTCHGEVKYMDKIHQVRSLTMGWCVSCHRENGASIDCWTCHK